VLFQSTCLREARRPVQVTARGTTTFQSTCLREARPRGCPAPQHPGDFNPRAYVRHDWSAEVQEAIEADFNPRAYVRHDVGDPEDEGGVGISIHVPT